MSITNDNDPQPDGGILDWVAAQYEAGVDMIKIGDVLMSLAIKLSLDAGGTEASCQEDFQTAFQAVRAADLRGYH